MVSRWFDMKEKAINLRREGYSIRGVEKLLKIPRSTLSGWFRSVIISKKNKTLLNNKWKKALIKARKKAVIWHNEQKIFRIKKSEEEARKVIQEINFKDKNIVDLALAMLYLGEGFKFRKTGMGNSNPLILKFFLKTMRELYGLNVDKIRFDLHIRYDQNPMKLKRFWSKELEVPIGRFKTVSVDIRTKGRKTYPNYKGVCMIDCANIAIQRKLVYLSNEFCEKVIESLRA